jgi:hypothetical protein
MHYATHAFHSEENNLFFNYKQIFPLLVGVMFWRRRKDNYRRLTAGSHTDIAAKP